MDALKKARAFMKEDGNKVRPWVLESDLACDGSDGHDLFDRSAADDTVATTVLLLFSAAAAATGTTTAAAAASKRPNFGFPETLDTRLSCPWDF